MQNRAILHSLSSGQTLGTVEVDEFGQDASYIEMYPGGYCDGNSVIINVRGESEGSDWNQRFLLAAHAMKVIRPIGPRTEDAESLFLPGNGMFVNPWSIEEIPPE